MNIERVASSTRIPDVQRAPAASSVPASAAAAAGAAPAAAAQVRDEFFVAAQALREAIRPSGPRVPQLHVDPNTRMVRVDIVDQASGEIVRQVPNEALQRFAEKWDAYVGSLLDEQA